MGEGPRTKYLERVHPLREPKWDPHLASHYSGVLATFDELSSLARAWGYCSWILPRRLPSAVAESTTRPASKPRISLATAIVQLRDAVQPTAMSSSQVPITQNPNITPPSSFANHPLTPPPTDEKQFAQVHRVIALFEEIRAGRHINRHPWTEFRLAEGDYDEIEC